MKKIYLELTDKEYDCLIRLLNAIDETELKIIRRKIKYSVNS